MEGCLAVFMVLPLCFSARSSFDQLRNSTTRKASKQRIDSSAASKFKGRPDGRITGTDMRHLLLLLPFLLFDLLHDEVEEHYRLNGTDHESPAQDLIAWVLLLLQLAGVVSLVQVMKGFVSLNMQ